MLATSSSIIAVVDHHGSAKTDDYNLHHVWSSSRFNEDEEEARNHASLAMAFAIIVLMCSWR